MQTIVQDNAFRITPLSHVGSKRCLWIGKILRWIAVGFLLFDSSGKILQVPPVIEGTVELGYPPDIVFDLGVTLLSCVVTYMIPRTSLLGAVLLTAYLGGAVATHVRVGSPLFTHVLFPTYVAALLWCGLILRDARLVEFLPFRGRS